MQGEAYGRSPTVLYRRLNSDVVQVLYRCVMCNAVVVARGAKHSRSIRILETKILENVWSRFTCLGAAG